MLLWFAGTAIRIPLLVVPPVVPLIHDDLHMSETQVGLLIGLPLVMFAIAAIPGSLLIARLGVLRVATAGLATTALAAAARSLADDVWTLYVATALMGFGVAIVQPALPTLARIWTPARIWLASAVYTNGMLIGATAASALTIPYVLPLVDSSWRTAIVAWAVPGLLVALLYGFAAPRPKTAAHAGAPQRWWPDWRDPQLWLLGVTLGTNNGLFFAVNAFMPDYLTSLGRSDLIGAALGWVNGAQLLASCILLTVTERIQRTAWPFAIFGPLTVVGLFGVVFGQGLWIVASTALVGFAAAVTFVVTFGLPAILSPPDDVHRMAGGMLTLSYTIAVIVPVICGAVWDLTGVPWMAFIPVGLCGICLTVFGTMLSLRSTYRQ
jgi:CP family cyanate transporter-like MFS transporter